MRKPLVFVSILSLLLCFSTSVLADLLLSEGKPTGQWYNPQRSGEGFYIEVIYTGGNQQIGVAMFTFDDNGDQLSIKRLSLNRNGQVRYELKTPYSNGTTHVLFAPLDFIARLVALVPRPRVNLTRFHGVFAHISRN